MGNYNIIQPKAATNLILNPSFETGTDSYTASGTNTIAQSTDYQFQGVYSLKCTYGNSLTMATYAGITITEAAHAYSARVFIPDDWDGGAISLAIANFVGATEQTASGAITTTGEWVRVGMVFTPLGSDLTGDLQINAASAPTGGKFIYVDCVQLETGTQSTTEFDGDSLDCLSLIHI